MKRLLIMFLAGLTFVFNLVNMSGLGSAYNTEHYTRILVIALSVVLIFRHNITYHKFDIKLLLWGALLAETFVFAGFLRGSVKDAFSCLSSLFIVYIFGEYKLDTKTFLHTGRMLLFGGFSLLLIYLKTDLLSGWNENGIAMISFFAYICYMASVMFSTHGNDRVAAIILSAIFTALLSQTDSRSSTICAIIATGIVLFPKRAGRWVAGKLTRRFILHFGLLLTLTIVLISGTRLYGTLDLWSIETFGKPLLNGRETLWANGLKDLSSHFLLGRGNFRQNNWHNWAMSLLTGYGVLGYVFWTGFVARLFDKGQPYVRDPYISGCIAAFLLILTQQSAELGLIGSTDTHLLPYMLLGFLLGRIRKLERSVMIHHENQS